MYAKSAKILTEAKRLIRTGGEQKEINKAFKAYQTAYKLSCHLYEEEDKKPRKKTTMEEVPTQKQKKTKKKKHKTEVVKLGDRTEMKATHMGGAAILELFKDGKRL